MDSDTAHTRHPPGKLLRPDIGNVACLHSFEARDGPGRENPECEKNSDDVRPAPEALQFSRLPQNRDDEGGDTR
jgi:hypothetical protein